MAKSIFSNLHTPILATPLHVQRSAPKLRWVAFFSRSGAEICDLAVKLGRYPDVVVTNREEEDGLGLDPRITEHAIASLSLKEFEAVAKERLALPRTVLTVFRLVHLPKKPSVEAYRKLLAAVQLLFRSTDPLLITLHGWLRIIPAEICEMHSGRIFNGHPALIDEYPDLKGLDQQESIVNAQDRYPYIGSVVHEVTAGVDEGKVIVSSKIRNEIATIAAAYTTLRTTSLASWQVFFKALIASLLESGDSFY